MFINFCRPKAAPVRFVEIHLDEPKIKVSFGLFFVTFFGASEQCRKSQKGFLSRFRTRCDTVVSLLPDLDCQKRIFSALRWNRQSKQLKSTHFLLTEVDLFFASTTRFFTKRKIPQIN